ncbi:MAG: M28 family peptidase, partial [Candidatus Marsarchaeota archaeon]|nr:M28 family peptidase [Candidatus Marsarchaeota archaeon]
MSTNKDRFLATFERFSRVGESGDGVNRLALNEHDLRVRSELAEEARRCGAMVYSDDIGNIFARIGEGSRYTLVGSHMDSVYNGGRFDGMYGVVSALETLRVFSDERHLSNGLTIADFTNEEGARFKPSLLGSGVTTGVFTESFAYSRIDRDGVNLGDALHSSGWMGKRENRLRQT